jgi:SPP1 gp7 family putative phage head morphogenesis protein
LVNTRAQEWAKRYSGELIANINDTTKQAVQQAVERWYGNGEPLSALVDDLQPAFSKRRAKLIAQTETTNAAARGSYTGFKESGVVTGVVWKTANDERVCSVCGALDGAIVSIDGGAFYDEISPELQQRFKRRFELPPAHPGCRCRIAAQVVPVKSFQGHRGRTGHVGGSLPRNAAAVSQAEQEIFGASKENAVIIDADGNVVLRKSGTKDRIAFTQDDAKAFSGNVFTHNHPNPEGYSGCVSFSDLDVQMASTYKVREMRAIGDKWAYSLQLSDDLEWKEINKAFQKASKQVKAEWQPLIVSKEMPVKDANANFHHEVWSRVGNAIGNDRFNYERYEHGY